MTNKTNELTDTELIQRCMDAPTDKVALEQFFSRFYGVIRMGVLRAVSWGKLQEHIVDDLVQEVCKKLLFAIRQKAIQSRVPASIKAYINVMIRSSIIDYIRSKKLQSHASFDESNYIVDNEELDPLGRMNSEDDKMLLEDAKKTLSETERQIIDMLLEGLSAAEIANQLNIGINSVYSLKWRSIKKLKTYIKQG